MDGIKLQAQTEEIETKSTKAMKVAPDGSFVNTGTKRQVEYSIDETFISMENI